MAQRLYLDANAGRVAIFEVPSVASTDFAPYYDPKNNLGRVSFHSDLEYIDAAYTVSSTLTLPAMPRISTQNETYTLFSHGMGFQPVVFGTISGMVMRYTVGGFYTLQTLSTPVGWLGSVPAQSYLSESRRFVHLGANGTNVLAHINGWATDAIPSITLSYTVTVTNMPVPS